MKYFVETFHGESTQNRKRDQSLSTSSDTASLRSEGEYDDMSYNEQNATKFQRTGLIKRVISSPSIRSLTDNNAVDTTTSTEASDDDSSTHRTILEENTKAITSLSRVTSMPSLQEIVLSKPQQENAKIDVYENTNPVELLKTLISSNGFDVDVVPVLRVKDYFEPITDEQIESYDNNITKAIRCEDLDALQKMQTSGRPMQCCNRFGESIMHMACRRGSGSVVKFLLQECGSSLRLRDDFGRTPLHDACWTSEINYGIIRLLLLKEPDLLLLSDKRGHTPLDYARRDAWGPWCQFLNQNKHLLCPKVLFKKR